MNMKSRRLTRSPPLTPLHHHCRHCASSRRPRARRHRLRLVHQPHLDRQRRQCHRLLRPPLHRQRPLRRHRHRHRLRFRRLHRLIRQPPPPLYYYQVTGVQYRRNLRRLPQPSAARPPHPASPSPPATATNSSSPPPAPPISVSVTETGTTLIITADGQLVTDPVPAAGVFLYTRRHRRDHHRATSVTAVPNPWKPSTAATTTINSARLRCQRLDRLHRYLHGNRHRPPGVATGLRPAAA